MNENRIESYNHQLKQARDASPFDLEGAVLKSLEGFLLAAHRRGDVTLQQIQHFAFFLAQAINIGDNTFRSLRDSLETELPHNDALRAEILSAAGVYYDFYQQI